MIFNYLNFYTIFLITYLVIVADALYEDQIGKFDWKRSYIGKPKFAKFDNNRVIVATEENVLAALNVKDGQIQWRQVLENPKEHEVHLLHIDRDIVTITGDSNNWFVRGWELTSGVLLWEWSVYSEKVFNAQWAILNRDLIHVSLVGSHIEIASYVYNTGQITESTKRINTPWLQDLNECVISASYFVCLSDATGKLYYINLDEENPTFATKNLESLIGNGVGKVQLINIEYSEPSVLILRNTVAKIFNLKTGETLSNSFLSNVLSIPSENAFFELDINIQNPEKLLKVKRKSSTDDNESSIDVEYPLGLGAPFILAGQCRKNICDLLLCSTDQALTMVRLPEGKVLWTREESLSNIAAVEFFELPVSEMDASIENEFKSNYEDVLGTFAHRISTQFKQLTNLFFGNTLLSSGVLVRDDFGLHQIIVVVTHIGKIFAIDTISGSTVWSYRLPHILPFENNIEGVSSNSVLLFVQRSAKYAPLSAVCTLLAKDAVSGNSILFQFDPITGHSKNGLEQLNYKVVQAMLLPYEDENHLKPFILINESNNVIVSPSQSEKLLDDYLSNIYLYFTKKNGLQGYRLIKNKAISVWNVELGANIVALSTRSSLERVHSQGRVLPDRSVYYKYVNPNLIAVATLSNDLIHKHVLSVYLIDGITGLVLYSTTHKRAKGPVEIVHSENWLVYSFFNERFRRMEIAAAELYEGHLQSNSSWFSSHAMSQLPQVQTQSYILAATPTAMAVTLTERGITNKCLLVALTSGAVTEIPWMLLQPRFADIPCGPEESCYPYLPEIPLPPEATINYNQTLERTKGIAVAPARLESTSHVLVHGLDIFYTRVAPSKTFDVLKEDFDHKLIVIVLLGFIVASLFTKALASRKALRMAWK